jgi:hypothetical protein
MISRPLNQMERESISGAVRRGRIPAVDLRHVYHNHLRVTYETMQGGFTVCILLLSLRDDDGDVQTYIWRGASRRSYKDRRKPVRGEMLAFSRAILYSRPLEI